MSTLLNSENSQPTALSNLLFIKFEQKMFCFWNQHINITYLFIYKSMPVKLLIPIILYQST